MDRPHRLLVVLALAGCTGPQQRAELPQAAAGEPATTAAWNPAQTAVTPGRAQVVWLGPNDLRLLAEKDHRTWFDRWFKEKGRDDEPKSISD